jgi:hypothetical protein
VRGIAERLLPWPTVELLGAAIPVGNRVVHVAHEDRVVRKVEEAGLLAQHRLAPLAILDVGIRSIPSDDVAASVTQGLGAKQEPTIRPVAAPHPRFGLARPPSPEDRAPRVRQARHVVRVNRESPAPSLRLLQGQTRILVPSSIEEVGVAIRPGAPRQCGDRVNGQSKPVCQRPRRELIAQSEVGCGSDRGEVDSEVGQDCD